MISLVLDVFGGLLLMVGLLLLTIGIVGVLRMRDTLSQLHAQGVATGPTAGKSRNNDGSLRRAGIGYPLW